jgi:hypothetical protein
MREDCCREGSFVHASILSLGDPNLRMKGYSGSSTAD